MLFYLCQCQSSFYILGTETFQKQRKLLAKILLQWQVLRHYHFSESLRINRLLLTIYKRVFKRWLSMYQLIKQAAERPNVDFLAVAVILIKHFRSDVLGRADHRVCQFLVILNLLTYAEIR